MIIFGLFALQASSWPPYTCQSRFYYQVTVHSCTAGASATVSKCLSTPEPSGQVSVLYCTAFICCNTFFAFKWVSVQFCTMLYFNNRIVNWSDSRCVSRWGNLVRNFTNLEVLDCCKNCITPWLHWILMSGTKYDNTYYAGKDFSKTLEKNDITQWHKRVIYHTHQTL